MALLGYDGRLTLERPAPEPLLFGSDILHLRTYSLETLDDKYWSGDKVTIFCESGLPTDWNPEGTAQYVGARQWLVPPSRQHIDNDEDQFYRADDTVFFYEQIPGDLVIQRTVYIHRDIMGRLSFYEDRGDALEGRVEKRLQLGTYDWGALYMFSYGTGEYQTAAINRYGRYDWQDYEGGIIGEKKLGCPCDCAPNWRFVCDLRGWDIQTDASAIDVTPIGVKFGENVKSLVTGSGSLDFLIERRKEHDWDASEIMKLVLMTEKGCNAYAQFWLTMDRDSRMCDKLLPGALYYDVEILMTSCAVSIRIEDAITGSANFVTTGSIDLKMGR